MGFLDSALGSVLNSGTTGDGQGALNQAIGSLLSQHGGIGGLVAKLAQSGIAEQTKAWVGTGPNPPVTGPQITQALGGDSVAQIAQQLGIDPGKASALLAQVLPHVVDHLTPGGQLPTGAAAEAPRPDAIGAALSTLAGKFLR